jgi:hypothetical protein
MYINEAQVCFRTTWKLIALRHGERNSLKHVMFQLKVCSHKWKLIALRHSERNSLKHIMFQLKVCSHKFLILESSRLLGA